MLAEVVRQAARTHGDAPAMVMDDRRVSFRELDERSDEVAAGLAKAGIGRDDVVAITMPSEPDYVIAYAGIAKAGAIASAINPRLAEPQRDAALRVLQPALVLRALEEVRAPGAPAPLHEPDPARAVAIVLTSGTTGAPKGAVFTEAHLAAIAAIDTSSGAGDAAPMLASTELSHIGFMTKLTWYLRRGMRIHMIGKWRASAALRTIAEQRIPAIGGIPAQIALMLREPALDQLDLSCVRSIVVGGGPSSPALVRAARERFRAPYSIRYSSTESGGVGTLTAMDAGDEEALHTVGRPRDGIALEVRAEDGTVVPPGETGEVCLRSPAVMLGYYRDEEATARALRDGWLHTGDLGFIDERGCLRLSGRRSEMFIRGGYNVHPAHVESVLSSHPAVAEVAVVPRPDEVMGEIGVAVVVPADPGRPPTLEELRAHAASSLARHELPEALRVIDALPLTSMHKLDRRRLAADEAAGAGGKHEAGANPERTR